MTARSLARLAWWQAWGRPGRLLLLAACIAVGVAARVGVGGAVEAFSLAIDGESRGLLLADLELSGRKPLDEGAARLAAVLPAGTQEQELVEVSTMVLGSAAGRMRTALVRALFVEPGFPLYGSLQLGDGRGAIDGDAQRLAQLFGEEPTVLAQRDLLLQLGLEPGDQLRVGRLSLRVIGSIEELPGLGIGGFALGGRVLIGLPQLPASGLAEAGALATFRRLYALPPGQDLTALQAAGLAALGLPPEARRRFAGEGPREDELSLRTHRDAQDQVSELFDRLAAFMALVSLAALGLGAVGAWGVLRGELAERAADLAVLRVLGAGPRGVGFMLGLWLLLASALGVLGGAVLGSVVQGLLLLGAANWLPLTPRWSPAPAALAWGATLALAALLVALAPALRAAATTPPLPALRQETPPLRRDPWVLLGLLATLALGLVVVRLEGQSWRVAALLVTGVLLSTLLLGLAGRLLLLALARLRGALPSFALRHALANLVRAKLRPGLAVTTLGLAAFALAALSIHRHSLVSELRREGDSARPDLFAINIQGRDGARVQEFLDQPGVTAEVASILRARLVAIDGVSAAELAAAPPTEDEDRRQAWLRREWNLSSRPQPQGGERLIAGRWFEATGPDAEGRWEATVDEVYARTLGMRLGSAVDLRVGHRALALRVVGLRAVDWASFRPNFFTLVEPGALEGLPLEHLAAIAMDDPQRRQDLQLALIEDFPELTIFDISATVTRVLGLFARVEQAVALLAGLAVLAGLLVVVAVAAAGARQRRSEVALLRALGASSGTLRLGQAVEFGLIGLVAGGLGGGIAIGGALLVLPQLTRVRAVLPWAELALGVLVLALVVALTGLVACASARRAPPAEVLREE